MGLVYCTRCGHRVSTAAPKCPSCGTPPYAAGLSSPITTPAATGRESPYSTGKTRAARQMPIRWLLIVIALIIFFARVSSRSQNSHLSAATHWVQGLEDQERQDRAHNSGSANAGELAEAYGSRAEEEFKSAINEYPDFPDGHLSLGDAYRADGRFDDASKEIRIAIKLLESNNKTINPRSRWQDVASLAYCSLGLVYIDEMGKASRSSDVPLAQQHLMKALGAFKKALLLDPTNSDAQANFDQYEDRIGQN